MYEYRVVKDYHDKEHGFDLREGEIVTDDDFHEPDIPARLVDRGVLEAADMEAEAERLKLFDVFDQDDNRVDKDGNILVANPTLIEADGPD